MQLIILLLAAVSILTILSGIVIFFGSSKGYRIKAFWFLLATIFSTLWMTAISIFLSSTKNSDVVDLSVKLTFISAILLDVAFLAYVSWKQKYGRSITLFYSIFGAVVSVLIAIKPELMYSNIQLAPAGNSVDINVGPLYISYVVFFATLVPAVVLALTRHYISKRKGGKKQTGDIVIMLSFGASSIITLVADLILPLTGLWDYIWLGPLALSAMIIGFYYTTLRYSNLNLNSMTLRILSYVVILTSLAILYMIIFAIVFSGMFRGATPSTEVIVLNFVMILIMMLLMPAINQLSNFVRSLITSKSKNITDEKDD